MHKYELPYFCMRRRRRKNTCGRAIAARVPTHPHLDWYKHRLHRVHTEAYSRPLVVFALQLFVRHPEVEMQRQQWLLWYWSAPRGAAVCFAYDMRRKLFEKLTHIVYDTKAKLILYMRIAGFFRALHKASQPYDNQLALVC